VRKLLVGPITVVALLASASIASATPIFMPTTAKDAQMLRWAQVEHASANSGQISTPGGDGITAPAPPCPENGVLYPPPAAWPSSVPYLFSNCGVTELPATGAPVPGNMSYWGGPVQVHPKEYLVYWGWTADGFKGWKSLTGNTTCSPEQLDEGAIQATLRCDLDGAGQYVANWVKQLGGTQWAHVSTQYYETEANGNQDYIQNDKDVLAGIWADNDPADGVTDMPSSNGSNPAGPTNTYWDLAEEAVRAAAHFGITGAALTDANFIIVQPPAYTDPNALADGYCAFHDFTDPNISGNSYYQKLTSADGNPAPYLEYTNLPYLPEINESGTNVCGTDFVNSGAAGDNDGFSVALGHEIEEEITDPGAEDLDPTTNTEYGGWYDTADADENGDKCAWVGLNPATDTGPPLDIPGATHDIVGNADQTFAVQSLWSNADDEGTGYCAGSGTDSGAPADQYGTGGDPDVPASLTPPSISGTAASGDTLTASPGTWTNSPTSYVYQWENCDSAGQGCTEIDGATSPTYTVSSSDSGRTLAVDVYAADTAASSPDATSAPTDAVGGSGLGVTGAQGPAGLQGSSGQQGAAGAQGPKGEQGTEGAAGSQGSKGDQGAPGATGAQGAAGFPGPAGPQGARGPQGPAGKSSKCVVTTVGHGRKGHQVIHCSFVSAAAGDHARVTMSRGRTVYASHAAVVHGGAVKLNFTARRALKHGRYLVTLSERAGHKTYVYRFDTTV
jgi:serine protease